METASLMPSIMVGSLMRATPPSRRMSDGTRSSAITATAPASSAIFACAGSTTSMITPPLSISARPRFTRVVPVSWLMGRGAASAMHRSYRRCRTPPQRDLRARPVPTVSSLPLRPAARDELHEGLPWPELDGGAGVVGELDWAGPVRPGPRAAYHLALGEHQGTPLADGDSVRTGVAG